MASNSRTNQPQTSTPNYIPSGSQPRGSQMPQTSGSGRTITGGTGGDAQGPVAIGGAPGVVDFAGAPLQRSSASVPRSAENFAIGGAGGRVRLPNSLRGECDIERGNVGTATVTEGVRNRWS